MFEPAPSCRYCLSMAEDDLEIKAIADVVGALEPLDAAARDRVLNYVSLRLQLSMPTVEVEPVARVPPVSAAEPNRAVRDIRSLKEEKHPSSANEMATLVAYYLAELAPEGERQETLTKDDLEKYFKQAQYPLPNQLRFTLRNAATAGYLDGLGDGVYKINPVGYNLVVHSLPNPDAASRPKRATKRRSVAKSSSPKNAAAKPAARAKAKAKPAGSAKSTPAAKAGASTRRGSTKK